MRGVAATKGEKTQTYYKALEYIQQTCRGNGIDAALDHTSSSGETSQLDALILCDRLAVGQQIAAQAGQHFLPLSYQPLPFPPPSRTQADSARNN
jgi:hypothetical protein